MTPPTDLRRRVLAASCLAGVAALALAGPAAAVTTTPGPTATATASPTSTATDGTGGTAVPTTPATGSPATTSTTTGAPTPVTPDPVTQTPVAPIPVTSTTPAPSGSGPGTSPPAAPAATPTRPGTAALAAGSALERAAAFVVAGLSGGDHVEGPFGADLGQTADVALGLQASGGQAGALSAVVGYLRANGGSYVHGDPSFGERAGAGYAGPTGKLALTAYATGSDPAAFGGIDLLTELRGLMVTTGAERGRFSDDSAFGDFSNPLGQAFDVLALERASAAGAPQASVDYLASAQCADGGFPESFGAATCTSSPDATGLAVQALVAAGADCPAARAVAWLSTNAAADGSYGSNAVDPTKPAVANVNSTAYAVLGLVAAAEPVGAGTAYLASVQNADGGLPTVPSASTASNLFATAQSLAALAGTSFGQLGAQPLAPAAPVCASPEPTATSTSTPTPTTATPTTSTPGSTTPSTPPTSSAAPVADTTSAGPDDPAAAPVSGPTGDLPRTGADLRTPVAVGLLLLVSGSALVLAGRRRAGRHA